ncbi:type III secretion system export apparatus subunit SctT [Pseudomonas syringae pv. aptata]|jgi:type III secretion protein T|uniref:Type III secretion protein SpaR/YscT/HrcT n=19 Tax=Pseudomonas TaxID=286 RepID=F3G225_PSESJ|nr:MULTISPECIES: type III secretion system export apparatus subunit SctT [Pseudomonas]EGH41125.1 type III secretion protein SpaR/YscT/HrcT [Pseudomonas syringae pv. pisi str. 1704B]KEZ68713.1 type III secretion system protein [Pseudomonas syringae pv. syringae FF5]MCW6055962.1 type III secretion system export apparatus subunit SctT [Pseudomonas fragi]AAY36260.1 type III secretion protein HrcT [Pseudomonas syringae pv. syringae B728a]AKF44796.1 type III secretion protein SpaR/YscT/HrcT [Pseudom
MPFDAHSAFQFMLGMGLAMARLMPCMLLVPAFCFKYLKGPLRYAVVAVMAMIPAPAISKALESLDDNWFAIGGLLIKEAVLGTLLGLLLYAPFWMFASVGALLDSQRGALSGGQLNPALGPDATPLGELFQETLIMLVILTGGLSLMTQIIWDSYSVWPPTAWMPGMNAGGLDVFLEQLNQTMQHMLLYAAPFIALLLLIEAAFAIIGLYAQQLNVSILAMPAKSMAGLAFLLIYLPTLLELGTGQLLKLVDLKSLLTLLVQVP